MTAAPALENRHAPIIAAVWDTIAEQGIGAVTLRRVAAAAGVSVGRIQHHFGTRENLLRTACRAMFQAEGPVYTDAAAPWEAVERIALLVHQPVPVDADDARVEVYHAFLAWSLNDDAMASMVRGEINAARAHLAELVRVAQGSGQLASHVAPDAAASALFALGQGLAQQVMAGAMSPREAHAAADEGLRWLTRFTS